MSIVRWNPIREMDDFFNRYSDFSKAGTNENLAAADWIPAVDIRESDKDYSIDVELPAIGAEDVNVSVKDGLLTVTGERKSEKETNDKKVHRVERQYGKFTRSFRLPEDANEEAINAKSKDGVLYLTIDKREEVKPRSIQVKVH